tara:strand:+ start:2863 stop:4668 length:1806 start_codon:yes stop_codon:yes gene_type:complete
MPGPFGDSGAEAVAEGLAAGIAGTDRGGRAGQGMDDIDMGEDLSSLPWLAEGLETGGEDWGIPSSILGDPAGPGGVDPEVGKNTSFDFNLMDVLFTLFSFMTPMPLVARVAGSIGAGLIGKEIGAPNIGSINVSSKGGTPTIGAEWGPWAQGDDQKKEDDTGAKLFSPTTEADRVVLDTGERKFKGGGMVGLRNQARNIAAQGRGGDSMLVHMRPDEVAGLRALGGVSKNPVTGLPENWMGSTLGSLAAMFFTGGAVNPFVMQGLGAGLGQFAESKIRGEDNALQRGMQSGLLAGLGSYGLSKLGTMGAEAATKAADAGKEAGLLAQFKGAGEYTPYSWSGDALVGEGASKVPSDWGEIGKQLMGKKGVGIGGVGALAGLATEPPPTFQTGMLKDTGPSRPPKAGKSRRGEAIDISGVDLSEYGFGPEKRFFRTFGAQEGGLMDAQILAERTPEGVDVVEQEVTAQAVSALRGDHPEPEKAITTYVEMFGEEQFGRLHEIVMEEMQIEEVAGREEVEGEGMIVGPGAGRDDLIRGSIEGEEELRVSDGEFIVPADAVSGLGDGSSNGGAKRLEAMIERIRRTRTGTERQPDRVDEAAMLPA